MIQYAIYLNDSRGREGWFMMIGDGILVTKEPALAQRSSSEEEADQLLSTLVLEHGLKRDEARIEQLAFAEEVRVELGEGDWPDLIEVGTDPKSGKKFLLVRDSGEETTEDIPPVIADLLVRVLSKIRARLSE